MNPESSTLLLIGDLLLFAGFPGLLMFTLLYGLRSRWNHLLAGRSLFYLSLAMTAVILLVGYTRASMQFGLPFPGREYIRMGVYFFVSLTLWRMFFTLIRYRRMDRRREQREAAQHVENDAVH